MQAFPGAPDRKFAIFPSHPKTGARWTGRFPIACKVS
jgi:hypothetical protein